jgi:hypothetical protein
VHNVFENITEDMNTTAAEAIADIGSSVATIASSASLVDMSISQWAARKKDKRASNEVAHANNAETGVANVTKALLSDSRELGAVHKMTSAIRVFHMDMTFPWGKHNLLPSEMYADYHGGITERFQQWQSRVDEFLGSYEYDLANMHVLADKMGTLFNPEEYPTVDEVSRKFTYRLGYYPVPQDDWRIQTAQDGLDQMRAGFNDYVDNNLKGLYDNVYKRLLVPLQRASEKLDYTIVSNLLDMAQIMERVNYGDDPELKRVRQRLEDALDGVTPDVLRDDEATRLATKRNIDDIINNLPTLM